MLSHNRRTGALIFTLLCALTGCRLQPLLRGCAGVLVVEQKDPRVNFYPESDLKHL